MRPLTAIVLLVILGGCQSWGQTWDWRAAGQTLIQSVCYTIGNCAVACSSGEEDPAAQCQ
jgi:hypothetical protein